MELVAALFFLLLVSVIALKVFFKIIEITWNNAFLILVLLLIILLI
jgi:hypothetical protein